MTLTADGAPTLLETDLPDPPLTAPGLAAATAVLRCACSAYATAAGR